MNFKKVSCVVMGAIFLLTMIGVACVGSFAVQRHSDPIRVNFTMNTTTTTTPQPNTTTTFVITTTTTTTVKTSRIINLVLRNTTLNGTL